jgi:hypothetical protein
MAYFIDSKHPASQVQIIPSDFTLKRLAGGGASISAERIREAERQAKKIQEDASLTFPIEAAAYLRAINDELRRLDDAAVSPRRRTVYLRRFLMELKAHAGFFGFPGVGMIAAILLEHLEEAERFDEDSKLIVVTGVAVIERALRQPVPNSARMLYAAYETIIQAVDKYRQDREM